MLGRRFIAGTVGVALLVLAGCQEKAAPEQKKADRGGGRKYLVNTGSVQMQPLRYLMETTGAIEAEDIYDVESQMPGTITGIACNEGDRVTAEQVICRISPQTYQLAAQKAKDAWRKAQADLDDSERRTRNQVARCKLQLGITERDVERRRPAFESGAVTADELSAYEDKRNLAQIELHDAEEAAKTDVESYRTLFQQRETEMKQAEDDLAKSNVVAPVTGTVDVRAIVNGAYVAAGAMIVRIVPDGLKLRFAVPERDSAHIRENTRVTFQLMPYPGRDFSATVYYVSKLSDAKTRLVTCWAHLDPLEGVVLKPGYFASIRIQTREDRHGMVVPLTAVLPTESGMVVFVVKDGKAQQRKVSLGMQLADRAVEILAGLQENDRVVIEGGNTLQDDVEVVESEMAAKPAKQGTSEKIKSAN